MHADDVLAVHRACARAGITIWIDGGWCVDALLGEQTRPHGDLDIAVRRGQDDRVREILTGMGYLATPGPEHTAWNYVMAKDPDTSVDIHVFDHDADGRVSYGIAYPAESLTGTGTIGGERVSCIAAAWMFTFKTAYPPAAKDRADARALAAGFGFALPDSHR
ncbi:nucleotidyltransferase domain-containing protein [Nocardia tengchongensis]|uniref:nucleotidyltransferase domain-containing protein n=1 Tax=Nocardia tengchongensis TaxID=2055889 RepID=UPI003683BCB6